MAIGLRSLLIIAIAGLGVTACTDGYGYSGVSLGYAGGGYGDGYYGDGYYDGGYGVSGPASYYGWYGDYYYPGTGYYVYDRYRRPYRWDARQRGYWEGRRHAWDGGRNGIRDNWAGFGRDRNRWDSVGRPDRGRDYHRYDGDRPNGAVVGSFRPSGYGDQRARTERYGAGRPAVRPDGGRGGYRGDRSPGRAGGPRGRRN